MIWRLFYIDLNGEVKKMNLNKVKIHPVNASFIVYLPKKWVEYMDLEKGDQVKWSIDENDFETLKLKKVV